MTNQDQQRIPRARTTGLVVRRLDNEVMVYDTDTHQAHCLNAAAASVWEKCDGQRTVKDLSIVLRQGQEAIRLALAQLGERNLLDQTLIKSQKPRLNRRQMMKAAGAAALIAVPLISTIMAPTAAQASTCVASGDTCSISAQCCSGLCNIGFCS